MKPFKKKDGRGRDFHYDDIWIVGVMCRDTKILRLFVTKNRNQNLLKEKIKKFLQLSPK